MKFAILLVCVATIVGLTNGQFHSNFLQGLAGNTNTQDFVNSAKDAVNNAANSVVQLAKNADPQKVRRELAAARESVIAMWAVNKLMGTALKEKGDYYVKNVNFDKLSESQDGTNILSASIDINVVNGQNKITRNCRVQINDNPVANVRFLNSVPICQ